ncbi:MFS transporter, partial [Candidatus Bathyarchaeota archaeon]|nr:MFS transporter [Candidatus Bathyarchaeota archaeon]
GRLFDRYGHRRMTTVVAAALGLACIWMSVVSSVPMLLVGFFLVRLLGQGSMSLSSVTLPPQWLMRRKGVALSIVSVGGGLSLAVLPPLNTWIIQNYGWRLGWQAWAVLLWAAMVPVGYLFIRDSPEEVGLTLDNEPQAVAESQSEGDDGSWTLDEAIHTWSFWFIIYTSVVPSAIITGLVFHQISILAQVGLAAGTAALISSVMSVVRLPVVLLAGPIADRVELRYLVAFSQALLLAAVAVIYFSDNVSLVMVYGALVGLQMALQGIVGGVIWPEYYGRRHLSTIRGVTMMAGVIGSALGPLPFGFAYDYFGGYSEVLVASMAFPLIGVIIGLLAKRPSKRQG